MADIKTSELTEMTSLSNGDLLNVSLSSGGSRKLTSGNLHTIFSNFVATTAPTSSNDTTEGYLVGSLWVDTTNDVAYICLDNSSGAAVWSSIGNVLFNLTGTDLDAGTSSNRMTNIDFVSSTIMNFDCGVSSGNYRFYMFAFPINPINYLQWGMFNDTNNEYTGMQFNSATPDIEIRYENNDQVVFDGGITFNEDIDMSSSNEFGFLNDSSTRVAGFEFSSTMSSPILNKDSTVSPFYFTGTGTNASGNGYYFVANQGIDPDHYLDIESDKLTIFTDVSVEDGSDTEVLSIDNATGDLVTSGSITASNVKESSFVSMIRGTTILVSTTAEQTISLDATPIDLSGSEYTISTGSNNITFDSGDGTKVYEVNYTGGVAPTANSGNARSYARIKAILGGVDVADSESWKYIRRLQQGATNTCVDHPSFYIQPTASQVMTFVFWSTSSDANIPPCQLENFVVTIKRVR